MKSLFSQSVSASNAITHVGYYNLSVAIEDDEIKEDLTNYETAIGDALEQLEIIDSVHEKLEKQADLNEELLEQAIEAAIKDDQAKASQAVLIESMEQLKYPIKEIKAVNISTESVGSPYMALVLSQENIMGLIKDVCGKTLDVIASVYDKLKAYAVKIKQFMVTKERLLNTLEVLVKENEDLDLQPLEHNKSEYIAKRFNLLLRLTDNILDVKQICEFIQHSQSNPILDKIDEIYKYLLEPDKEDETRKSVIRSAAEAASKSELQQKAVDLVNKQGGLKYKALYPLSIIANKAVFYCDTIDKFTKETDKNADDGRSLGITKETYKISNDAPAIKEIAHYKKMKDLLPIINEIRGLSRGANAYLEKLLRGNRLAYDNVKKATSDMRKDALVSSFKNILGSNGALGWAKQALDNIWEGVSIKWTPEDEENSFKYIPDPTRDALNIIKEIGNNSVYEMMSNYYKNVGFCAEVMKMLVESTKLKIGWI